MTTSNARLALEGVITAQSQAVRLVTPDETLPEWAVAPGTMDFAYELPESASDDEHLGCSITFGITHPQGGWAVKVVLHFHLRTVDTDPATELAALLDDVAPLDRLCWPDVRNAAKAAAHTIDAPLRLGGEHPRLRPGADLPSPGLSDTAES